MALGWCLCRYRPLATSFGGARWWPFNSLRDIGSLSRGKGLAACWKELQKPKGSLRNFFYGINQAAKFGIISNGVKIGFLRDEIPKTRLQR